MPVFANGSVIRLPLTPRLDTAENRVAELETGQAVAGSELHALTARVAAMEQQRLDVRIAVAESTLTQIQALAKTQYALLATLLTNLAMTGYAIRRRTPKECA